jgi:hypothetical protein
MGWKILVCGVGLLAAAAPGQQPETGARPASQLVLISSPEAQKPQGTLAQIAFRKLVALHEAEKESFSQRLAAVRATDAYKEAAAAKNTPRVRELMAEVAPVDTASYVAIARLCAERSAGDDDALLFLNWLVRNDRAPESMTWTIETIKRDHSGSAALQETLESVVMFGRNSHKDALQPLVETVIQANKDPEVLATAYFAKARYFGGTEEDLAKVSTLAPNSIVAARAEAPKFEKTRLQIGMVAPDIEGVDLEGVPFKLSDYRGRVVVLDFWGDW